MPSLVHSRVEAGSQLKYLALCCSWEDLFREQKYLFSGVSAQHGASRVEQVVSGPH